MLIGQRREYFDLYLLCEEGKSARSRLVLRLPSNSLIQSRSGFSITMTSRFDIVDEEYIVELKCHLDENHIFSIEAILRHKQVACMRRKCCLLFSNISFCSRDIQVFKICKLA